MKFTKRAITSIVRRMGNSLILLLIVFILANVLLTTVAVTHSLDSTKKAVLAQLKPTVTMELDYTNHKEDTPITDLPQITADLADKVVAANKDLIESYDYSRYAFGENKVLERVKLPGSESMGDGEANTAFSLVGTQTPFSSDVALEQAGIVKGKGFLESDIKSGGNKTLISKEFAELNNLDIGSIISIQIPVYDYDQMNEDGTAKVISSFTEEVEVAGILDYKVIHEYKTKNKDTNQQQVDYMKFYEADIKANGFILPNATIKRINDKVASIYIEAGKDLEKLGLTGEYVVPTFVLKDYKDVAKFVENSKKVVNNDLIAFNTVQDQYKQVAKPLESMGGLLNMIFTITIIASVVILSLVLCIFIYFRQKEMGIYLALGERKSRIIGQLLIETVIVALIGATLAIFTGLIFSSMLSDSVLASMLTPEAGQNMQQVSSQIISPEMISAQYQNVFSINVIVLFYFALIATVVIAQLITVLYLLRFNPKKILM